MDRPGARGAAKPGGRGAIGAPPRPIGRVWHANRQRDELRPAETTTPSPEGADRAVSPPGVRSASGSLARPGPGVASGPRRSGVKGGYRAAPALLGALVAATLAWAICLRHGVPGDLDTFLRAGAAVVHGRNPFPRPGDGELRRGDAFVYPWAVAFLFVPWALLPTPLAIAIARLAAAASLVAAVKLSDLPLRLVGLLLVASPVLVAIQVGSLEPFLVVGLVAAWRWRDRWWAGVLLGLATATKLFLLPLLAWPWASSRVRLGAISTLTAAAVIGTSLVAGPLGLVAEVHLLSHLASRESARGWSAASLLHGLGLPGAQAIGLASGIGLTLVGSGFVWRHRAPERLAYAAGIVGALLATPISWSHYLVMTAALLPALAASGVGAAGLAAGAAGSWFLVTPHRTPDALGLAIVTPALVGLFLSWPSARVPSWSPPSGGSTSISRGDRHQVGGEGWPLGPSPARSELPEPPMPPRRWSLPAPGRPTSRRGWWPTTVNTAAVIAVAVALGAIGWIVDGPSRLVSPWIALGGLVWSLVWIAAPGAVGDETRPRRPVPSSLKSSSHAPEESRP